MYTVKETESEYHIQNNHLLYKIHQTHQNTLETQKYEHFKQRWKQIEQNTFHNFILLYIYQFHNSYFAEFVFWVF